MNVPIWGSLLWLLGCYGLLSTKSIKLMNCYQDGWELKTDQLMGAKMEQFD